MRSPNSINQVKGKARKDNNWFKSKPWLKWITPSSVWVLYAFYLEWNNHFETLYAFIRNLIWGLLAISCIILLIGSFHDIRAIPKKGKNIIIKSKVVKGFIGFLLIGIIIGILIPNAFYPPFLQKETIASTQQIEESQEIKTPPSGMVQIKSEGFNMGSDLLGGDLAPAPQHYVTPPAYWIDAHEITNGEYKECVGAGVCDPPKHSYSLSKSTYFGNSEFNDFPVIWVSYEQASDYCLWIGGNLPTEEQWERAARGQNSFTYPWGESTPMASQANLLFGVISDTSQVGFFSADKSPDGIYDLVGNVSEWTSSWYISYPRNQNTFDFTNKERVIRGSNFREGYSTNYSRLYYRRGRNPEDATDWIGFRCVWIP